MFQETDNRILYKPFQSHWVVVLPDGSIYAHCDTVREAQEEIETYVRERIEDTHRV